MALHVVSAGLLVIAALIVSVSSNYDSDDNWYRDRGYLRDDRRAGLRQVLLSEPTGRTTTTTSSIESSTVQPQTTSSSDSVDTDDDDDDSDASSEDRDHPPIGSVYPFYRPYQHQHHGMGCHHGDDHGRGHHSFHLQHHRGDDGDMGSHHEEMMRHHEEMMRQQNDDYNRRDLYHQEMMRRQYEDLNRREEMMRRHRESMRYPYANMESDDMDEMRRRHHSDMMGRSRRGHHSRMMGSHHGRHHGNMGRHHGMMHHGHMMGGRDGMMHHGMQDWSRPSSGDNPGNLQGQGYPPYRTAPRGDDAWSGGYPSDSLPDFRSFIDPAQDTGPERGSAQRNQLEPMRRAEERAGSRGWDSGYRMDRSRMGQAMGYGRRDWDGYS